MSFSQARWQHIKINSQVHILYPVMWLVLWMKSTEIVKCILSLLFKIILSSYICKNIVTSENIKLSVIRSIYWFIKQQLKIISIHIHINAWIVPWVYNLKNRHLYTMLRQIRTINGKIEKIKYQKALVKTTGTTWYYLLWNHIQLYF